MSDFLVVYLLIVVNLIAGTQMVFFILNTVVALGTLMTFKPFLVEKRKTQTNQLS